MKPMLASDWDEGKVRFPCLGQPKVDGVRGLNMHGGLTGRSLKLFKNRHATSFFSQEFFRGFDGELAAAHECDPALCRITTSAVGTITGEPFLLWWLFDYVAGDVGRLRYAERYRALERCVRELQSDPDCLPWAGHLRVVPSHVVNSMAELEALDEHFLNMGYEGTILRDPDGLHKQGRSTAREGGLLRIKRFVDEEGEVLGIEEGRSNQNEAQTNELGLQFRSSHQENMVPNGMVGNLIVKRLTTGEVITVGPGNMPHSDRKRFFEQPELIVGKIIKFKHFPKGVKDKPRFPTYICIRDESDL